MENNDSEEHDTCRESWSNQSHQLGGILMASETEGSVGAECIRGSAN
ncbi:MAG: hypothetical protein Alis3KO_41290 [Aliiglaciecola sp.]